MKIFYIAFLFSYIEAAHTVTIEGGTYTVPHFKSFYTNHKEQTFQIDKFLIDKYEVSNKQFGKNDISEDDIDFPVIDINYNEALQYCNKKGGTLPTATQWLIASSFENNKFYPYATKNYPILDENDINVKEERAVELEKNGFGADIDFVNVQEALIGNNGIVGMIGNVWEMTLSNSKFVILKGGSFYNNENKELLNNFIENKVQKSELKKYEHIGFRCVYKVGKNG